MDNPLLQDAPDVRWQLVAIKLEHLLQSVPSTVTPFDNDAVAWSNLPASLAQRGLVLRGMPAACIPRPDDYVHGDKVYDDLFRWSQEKLLALDYALDNNDLTVAVREPLSRRVIFELVDMDGTRRESTLGFSEDWQLRNMFKDQIYQARTSLQLRAINIDSLLPLLRNANLTTTNIPWASLPSKLWSTGQYMSGIPRICLPVPVGDKFPSDAAAPSTNWKKEQRVALQRCIDSGMLKVLPRPPGSSVIFEVLESNGTLVRTDLGLSDKWKLQCTPVPSKGKRPVQKKIAREPQDSPLRASPAVPWPKFHQTPSYQKKMNVTEIYMTLLRAHGLLLDSPEGPAWVYVPQMLATKRLYVSGLPRICLPFVRDDDVIANYDPRQWSEVAQDAFLQVFGRGLLHARPITPGERVLYKVLEPNGDLVNDCLGFSNKWCRDNLDFPDFSTLSPHAQNIEMWLEMLESVGIPCHDLRGRRRIQWLQLPLTLAHRRLYVSGCPLECFPRAQDDVVVELSSPYFYDEHQTAVMYKAFTNKQVSIRPRPPQRNVLFALEDDAGSMDFTCGFTSMWLQMNLHTIPNAVKSTALHPDIAKPVQMDRATPSIGAPNNNNSIPPSSTLSLIDMSSSIKKSAHVLIQPGPTSQRKAAGALVTKTAYPTPTDSAPASPMTLPPATSQPKSIEDQSRSLKIIIPAFKRRQFLAIKPAISAPPSHPIEKPYAEPGPSKQPSLPPSVRPATRLTHSNSAPVLPNPMLHSRRSFAPAHSGPRRYQRQRPVSPLTSDTEDSPGTFGPRESMSPRLPPVNTLPNPLPPIPIPTFLPKPGGNLRWDVEKYSWELTISELWPPEEWKKSLPVFPARVLWNAAQKIWLCEPSKSLTHPDRDSIGLSPPVRADLYASVRDGELDPIEEGLSIIWHRWRRSWGLFEYTPHKPTPPVS